MNPDLFGRALLDWAKGGTEPEYIERRDGLVVEGAGHTFYLGDRSEWPSSERQALRFVRGRALDVGCGAGRVALHLQAAGYEVTGIDLSPNAIKAARRRGLRDLRQVSAEELTPDLCDVNTIILFGNNFGMFGGPQRIRRVLTGWAAVAAPGTRLLAESTTPYHGGAPALDRRHYQRNKARGQMPGRICLRTQYRGGVGPWEDWLFVSRREMQAIVKGTGWQPRVFLGDVPSDSYVAVFEREG
ncbi:MAG TPA: methyltransferase domain-containing protein [Acidimicrobiales bacterium]